MNSEIIGRWKALSEGQKLARQRRALVVQVLLVVGGASLFCSFISILIGVPQSFLGQWWMSPPRYPGAVEARFVEGEVCQMPAPGVYCYEWFYRTNDSVEDVVAYYEGLEWQGRSKITFEWKRGRRFGFNWVAEDEVRILSNVCGYQIVVHPSSEGDTEVYILERGGMGALE